MLTALALAVAAPAVEPAPLLFELAPPDGWEACPLSEIEIAMVGDVMVHVRQLRAAQRPDGRYDFDGVFAPIAPWLRSADLAIGNLETVIAGEDRWGYTGFPFFNSPDALLDALADAGIDVLQTANNHSLDRGELGVLRTLDAIEARGLGHVGTWRTLEDRSRPWREREVGGVRIAIVASTFSTNQQPLPEGKPWMVAHFRDRALVYEVARARAEADLVIAGVHWGEEYEYRPTPRMVDLAHRLVAAGADIVMGTHPHVLQPAEVVRAVDRHGRPREALVLYSLGNLVSNMRSPFRHGAAIARATVRRCDRTGRTWLAGARFTPFWVDDTLADGTVAYRVVPTPPLGTDRCDDLDLSAQDCRAVLAMRAHAAETFTAGHLDWSLRPDPLPIGFDWTGNAGRWWAALPAPTEDRATTRTAAGR